MSDLNGTNIGLESLLELDGEIFPMRRVAGLKSKRRWFSRMTRSHMELNIHSLFTIGTIRELLVMTMLMGLSPKTKGMEQRKPNGITNTINTTSGFTNLRVLASYWKISGRM